MISGLTAAATVWVAALGASGLDAQAETVAEPSPPPVEEIVVSARTKSKAAAEFVRRTAAPTKRGLLARWTWPMCPAVIGFPETYGRFVADRLAQEAGALGVQVSEPGCRPNVLVLVTPDGRKAAEDLRARYPMLFRDRRPNYDLASGGGKQTVREFVERERPIRMWHVADLGSADGRPTGLCNFDALDPTRTIPCVEGTGSSRLNSFWRESMMQVFLIVDTSRLQGASYEQLASYVSFVTLAQIEPEADPCRYPSILCLFRDREAGEAGEPSLSAYDRAYLKGLYGAAPDANLNTHRRAIAEAVAEVVGPEALDPPR